MTTIDYCRDPESGTVVAIPLFEYLAQRLDNIEYEALEPTEVGVTRTGDLLALPSPAPRTRLEIERTPSLEEIRYIDTKFGTYTSAVGSAAIRLITQWDTQESVLFGEADPLPDGSKQWALAFFRCIVEYDNEGYRILPPYKRAGEVKSVLEWDDRCTGETWEWMVPGFGEYCVVSVRTGEFWSAKGEVFEKLSQRMDVSEALHAKSKGPQDGSS